MGVGERVGVREGGRGGKSVGERVKGRAGKSVI